MKLDLHMHTTCSDGSWSPEAVVRGAYRGGLDVISVTDHDTAAGYEPARAAAEELALHVIPGIEVSSTFQGRDIHILGYFFDPEAEAIKDHAQRAGRRRDERMLEMLDRLGAQGIEIAFEEVEAVAGPERGVLGRPHLAGALVRAGHAHSVADAFHRLIGDDCPAFVPTRLLVPDEAVDVIALSGGISIWAHPPSDLVDALLPGLLDAGLDGMEVYRPRNRREDTMRLESICRTRGLLISGGSDWHAPDAGPELGDFHVEADEIEALLEAGRL